MSGRKRQRMSGLPVLHARAIDGGALCGARRKWGVLTVHDPSTTDCKRCQSKLAKLADTEGVHHG